jgi:hypothetical protein
VTEVDCPAGTPRLCVLSLSEIRRDSRVLRQIDHAAAAGYEVTAVGWGSLTEAGPRVHMTPLAHRRLPAPERGRQLARMAAGRWRPELWEQWYWRKPDHRQALDLVVAAAPDIIHVNRSIALPIGIRAAEACGAAVLFDAHDYCPRQSEHLWWWRWIAGPFYTYLIRRYAPRADAMVTVCAGLAAAFQAEFGLAAAVVMNAPAYQALPFRPVDPQHIRLIHHGGATTGRAMERMIDLMALADARYSLDFMLVEKDAHYVQSLRRRAAQVAPERIRFQVPVPPRAIAATINAYDVGLAIHPPTTFNYAHALPSKFFEFIMAGLAVLIGPSVEMIPFAQDLGLGVVADTFEPPALAARLNALTAGEIEAMKRHSLQAAHQLNAEVEQAKLHEIYAAMLAVRASAAGA